jgi:hypothetical protein
LAYYPRHILILRLFKRAMTTGRSFRADRHDVSTGIVGTSSPMCGGHAAGRRGSRPPTLPSCLLTLHIQILRQRAGVFLRDTIEDAGELAGHKSRSSIVAVAVCRLRPPEQPFLSQAHTGGHRGRVGDVTPRGDLSVDRVPQERATPRSPRMTSASDADSSVSSPALAVVGRCVPLDDIAVLLVR